MVGDGRPGGPFRAPLLPRPAAQRAGVTPRDRQGVDAAEACNILEISESNQRVLLHRARAKVRKALEETLR